MNKNASDKELTYSPAQGAIGGGLGFGLPTVLIDGLNAIDKKFLLPQRLKDLDNVDPKFKNTRFGDYLKSIGFNKEEIKSIKNKIGEYRFEKRNWLFDNPEKLYDDLVKEFKVYVDPKSNSQLFNQLTTGGSQQGNYVSNNNMLGNKLSNKIFNKRLREFLFPGKIGNTIGGYCPMGRRVGLGLLLGGIGATLGGLKFASENEQPNTNDSSYSLAIKPARGILAGGATTGGILGTQALANKLSEKSLIDKFINNPKSLKGLAASDLMFARQYSANKKFYPELIGDISADDYGRGVFEDRLKGNELSNKFNKFLNKHLDKFITSKKVKGNGLYKVFKNNMLRPGMLGGILAALLGSVAIVKNASASESPEFDNTNTNKSSFSLLNSLFGAGAGASGTYATNNILMNYLPTVKNLDSFEAKLNLPIGHYLGYSSEGLRQRILNAPLTKQLLEKGHFGDDFTNHLSTKNAVKALQDITGKKYVYTKSNKNIPYDLSWDKFDKLLKNNVIKQVEVPRISFKDIFKDKSKVTFRDYLTQVLRNKYITEMSKGGLLAPIQNRFSKYISEPTEKFIKNVFTATPKTVENVAAIKESPTIFKKFIAKIPKLKTSTKGILLASALTGLLGGFA